MPTLCGSLSLVNFQKHELKELIRFMREVHSQMEKKYQDDIRQTYQSSS